MGFIKCDGKFPEDFNSSFGIEAQYLRLANAIMTDTIGKRSWDVPCTAEHIRDFITCLVRDEKKGIE